MSRSLRLFTTPTHLQIRTKVSKVNDDVPAHCVERYAQSIIRYLYLHLYMNFY